MKEILFKNISVPTYIVEDKVSQLDINYFIKKINKNIITNKNNNYKTNVLAKMTQWSYFIQDPYFFNFLKKINKTIVKVYTAHIKKVYPNLKNNNMKLHLKDAWGVKYNFNDSCSLHDHRNCEMSGVLYLSKNKSGINFPEYNLEILPEPGKFILYSPILQHEVLPVLEKKPRYCIAFNFYISSFK